MWLIGWNNNKQEDEKMEVKVEMAGGKGRVSFEMELEPENSYLDRLELFFNNALKAYNMLKETETETERRMA